ncbi:MAG: hypothetical protein GY936_11385 [Ignavibacteriae bacterium]|nr:hypothetical protein [Ignavibacteriota bacterium]
MDDWLKHPNRDEYWQMQNHRGIAKADVISIAGWYDIFLLDQLADFEALNSKATDNRLIVTYFYHGSAGMGNDYGGSNSTGDPGMIAKQYLVNNLRDNDSTIFKPPLKMLNTIYLLWKETNSMVLIIGLLKPHLFKTIILVPMKIYPKQCQIKVHQLHTTTIQVIRIRILEELLLVQMLGHHCRTAMLNEKPSRF